MNFGIIGCGLIGNKRALSIKNPHKISWVYDLDQEKAKKLAQSIGSHVKVSSSAKELLSSKDVDAVIIATIHNMLAPLTFEALSFNKHVLVEKPAACNSDELDPIINLSKKNNLKIKVGFNHRFHPAILKAKELCASKELGEIMYVRGRYGHGGRLGYDKEWRADKNLSGGGELVDQGSHLIDLSRYFIGDFEDIDGFVNTYFWNMKVEDNCFLILKSNKKQVAWLHASWTEWKNTFSFEIFCKYGKLEISGLGRSYGVEKLTYYKMSKELTPPETFVWEYPGEDKSWDLELEEFIKAIQEKREPIGNIYDAKANLDIIKILYNKNI
jgi:predicted dehydrogenase